MSTRGRPRVDNIFRFNVATDLTDNKRFIKFKRLLGVDVPTAYLTLVRFFNFIAANYALSGRIKANSSGNNSVEDADVIAEYCFWPSDPQKLVDALLISGIIEQDGTIHEWFGNQPYAVEKLRKRDNSSGNIPISSGNNSPPIAKSNVNTKSNTHSLDSLENKSISNTAMSNAARTRNENVDNSKSGNACPLPVETDLQRINPVDTEEFLERVGEYVALDENSRTGIIADIAKAKPSNESLFPILDQLAMAAADGRLGVPPVVENGRVITRGISNPVGWIRTQIKKTRASP